MLFAQCSIRIFVFQTALSISYIGVVKQRKIRDPPFRGIVKSELVEIPKIILTLLVVELIQNGVR